MERSSSLRRVSMLAALLALVAASFPLLAPQARGATSGDMVISGVVDGPLTGGIPKAIELYVVNNIADLSAYGVGSANNGNGGGVEEFTFPAVAATAGQFIYVASESTGFNDFFGFMPDYTSSAASINGDDAIELFMSGGVVDVFGDINVDGTGQPWEYMDGWAYRNDGTGQDEATFVLANWTFSGPNALDGETTNATAATPFPIGTFSPTGAPTPTPLLASGSATPSNVEPGDTTLLTVAVTPATLPDSTGITVVGDLTEIGGSATQAFFDDGTNGDVTAGDNVFSFQATVSPATAAGAKSLPATASDAESRTADTTISLAVVGSLEIWEIQGSGQFSPFEGDVVQTSGIVTLVDSSGTDAWIQTPLAHSDNDPTTSDGILIDDYSSLAGPPPVGSFIVIRGQVEEVQFGTALPVTRIDDTVLIENQGAAFPDIVPEVISDLPNESIPDGEAFWEAREGMLVKVADNIVTAPTNGFGEFGTLTPADAVPGSGYEPSVNQILLRSTAPNVVDYNPERIQYDDDGEIDTPDLRPGDEVRSAIGVVDYTFSMYKLQLRSLDYTAQPLPSVPVSTRDTRISRWRHERYNTVVTTYNVENLFDLFDNPNKDDGSSTPTPAELETQLTKLALSIKHELKLPEILVLQEVENTWIAQQLGNRVNDMAHTDYIATSYETSDGRGIEVAFLWDAKRVNLLESFQLSGPDVEAAFGPSSASPGREPIYGKFKIGSDTVHIVGNHFKSKGGDDPIYGVSFNRITEVQRKMQAQVVRDFVLDLMSSPAHHGPNNLVLVAGDLNDFQFGEPGEGPDHPVSILEGVGGGVPFTNLIAEEKDDERFSYLFDGNSQVLDHALVSPALRAKATGADFLHFNAGFPASAGDDPTTTIAASDHDPLEIRLNLRNGNRPPETPRSRDTRFSTFNASLNRFNAGDLVDDLSTPLDTQAQNVAETIQRTRPDVILINEFDYDEGGVAAQSFQDNYLSISQNGALPIQYPYRYVAPSNTGIDSGRDLNKNDVYGEADDAFGFGFFEGQYAFVVYSMHPIQTSKIRTFQHFLWKDMPGAMLPENPDGSPWYDAGDLDVFRLSSKNHVDVPIRIGWRTVHFLVSHPTPPVFDGPEDRNGTRNHDEIRFWADYISGGAAAAYIYDDDGKHGGLHWWDQFVIAGDLNADPFDGDSIAGTPQQLLDHPKVNSSRTPTSEGAVEQAVLQDAANDSHIGDPKYDTADFADLADDDPGNLRVDYVLPQRFMWIRDSGVFWPLESDPLFRLVGTYPFPTSDHRLVWVDVRVS